MNKVYITREEIDFLYKELGRLQGLLEGNGIKYKKHKKEGNIIQVDFRKVVLRAARY